MDAGTGRVTVHLRHLVAKVNRQLFSVVLASALLATAAAAAPGGKPGKGGKGGEVSTAGSANSPAAEQAAALRDYLGRDLVFITAPGIEAYLGDIARALLATRPDPPPVPRFLVQSTDEFTVFTDARGNIVVGSEVLRQAQSEDEIAAALSHELAHVIARDAQAKTLVMKIPYTVETLGVIAGAVDARTSNVVRKPGQLTGFAKDSLAMTQSVGTVWADFFAPSWNRQQEREADLAGVDMVRAAGYDPGAFNALFTRIDAAHAVRSDRVERVRQEALKKVQASAPGTPAAKASDGDQIRASLKQAGSDAQTAVVQAVFDGLAGWGTDYDPPAERTAAVLAYVQQGATTRRDKTRRSPRFAAELRDGPGGELLAADRAAIDLLATLKAGKPAPADAGVPQQLGLRGAEPLSPHLNLAIGTWLEARRRPAEAEQRAAAWLNTDFAPRSAYLWRASYQAGRREFDGALATLEQGGAALDDRTLFLPQMVAAAKGAGNAEKAEQLAIECGRSGVRLDLGTISRALEKDAPAKARGTYGECVAALGYDPIEKGQKAQATDPNASRGAKKAAELNKKMSEIFRKLGN